MSANPPGVVEQKVRDLMRAELIRQTVPLILRQSRRVDWARVLIGQRCRVAGSGRGRR